MVKSRIHVRITALFVFLATAAVSNAQAAIVWININPSTCATHSLSTVAINGVTDGDGNLRNDFNGTAALASCGLNLPANATIDYLRIWGKNTGSGSGTFSLMRRYYYGSETAVELASLNLAYMNPYSAWQTSLSHVVDTSNYAYFVKVRFPAGGALSVGHIEVRYSTP